MSGERSFSREKAIDVSRCALFGSGAPLETCVAAAGRGRPALRQRYSHNFPWLWLCGPMTGTLRTSAICLPAFFLVCFYFQTQSFSAEQNEEQQLIRLLQSNASPREKDAACTRLKRIGTEHSIPALAALLTDDQLSHSARYALESMPYPK